MKLQLVDDWKKCHKWLSVQLSGLGALAGVLWNNLDTLQKYISPSLMSKIAVGVFIAIMVCRNIKQTKEDTKGA